MVLKYFIIRGVCWSLDEAAKKGWNMACKLQFLFSLHGSARNKAWLSLGEMWRDDLCPAARQGLTAEESLGLMDDSRMACMVWSNGPIIMHTCRSMTYQQQRWSPEMRRKETQQRILLIRRCHSFRRRMGNGLQGCQARTKFQLQCETFWWITIFVFNCCISSYRARFIKPGRRAVSLNRREQTTNFPL